MSAVFYPGQYDYVEKLNLLGNLITDTQQTAVVGTTTVNMSLGANFLITLAAGNTTLAFSNIPSGSLALKYVFIIRQDSVGSRTVTWPASVKWPSGTVVQPSTGANRYTVFELVTFDSGTIWFAYSPGQNYI